jgi:hypothetical protein
LFQKSSHEASSYTIERPTLASGGSNIQYIAQLSLRHDGYKAMRKQVPRQCEYSHRVQFARLEGTRASGERTFTSRAVA